MITIEQFNNATSRYTKRMLRLAIATSATVFGCLAIVIPFRDSIRGFYVAQFDEVAAELLLGMTPFPIVLVMLVGICLVERHSKRDEDLHCPHCRKRLSQIQHLVIATRNCGFCGKQVLHEPAAGSQ